MLFFFSSSSYSSSSSSSSYSSSSSSPSSSSSSSSSHRHRGVLHRGEPLRADPGACLPTDAGARAKARASRRALRQRVSLRGDIYRQIWGGGFFFCGRYWALLRYLQLERGRVQHEGLAAVVAVLASHIRYMSGYRSGYMTGHMSGYRSCRSSGRLSVPYMYIYCLLEFLTCQC